jgi:hypothetical protein
MVIPIEFGMISKNLKAAAYEEEDAQEIDKVVDPQPNGETKFSRIRIHVEFQNPTANRPFYRLGDSRISPFDMVPRFKRRVLLGALPML